MESNQTKFPLVNDYSISSEVIDSKIKIDGSEVIFDTKVALFPIDLEIEEETPVVENTFR